MNRRKIKKLKRNNYLRGKFNKNSKKTPPPKRVLSIAGMLLLAAFAGVFCVKYFHESDLFTVKAINSNEPLNKNIHKIVKGKPILNLDIKKFYSSILKDYPEYKDVIIYKELPSTLRVQVTKRKPFAQLEGKIFFPIDREGVVLDSGSIEKLDSLVVVSIGDIRGDLKTGNRLNDDRLEYSFKLIDSLMKYNLLESYGINFVNAATINDLHFFIGSTKVFVGKHDSETKINRLIQVLEKKLNNDLTLIDRIDLRFKRVFIGYKR
ncbi:MAG: hypothetical protein ABH872_01550 [Candidatus Omnitrophota bacterium]